MEEIENPGKIKIYISGKPKDQNKCLYKIGSSTPAGSDNDVFKCRSLMEVSSLLHAPAVLFSRKSVLVIIGWPIGPARTCSEEIGPAFAGIRNPVFILVTRESSGWYMN
jgi:hypothetical protein